MKKWTIGKPDEKVVSSLQSQSDLSRLCCKVLAAQGCDTIAMAGERIGCTELSDPFLIRDMREAADCINEAIDSGKRICVYGDYDCDGVMATVILYSFLMEMGADVTWRIPERSEGYGLNIEAVKAMHADGVELIVTVDNGISSIKEAKLIAELGMELVITDHHQPGSELPEAVAIVDPHRSENFSPFRLYCGAGLALLLVSALNEGDTDMAMEQFGDLAAAATIADIVSLTGENRYLVEMGLQYLENTERPGLRALREISGIGDKPLTAGTVAFSIAPRINAAGRMASASLAVKLLLEENPSAARALAEELNEINATRKECESQIVAAALDTIADNPHLLHERVLVFSGKDWHTGVIGITASRLLERFGKPCFMISVENGVGHGSARSFGAFSVFECLTYCKDCLEKYGGHPAAGGFTILEEHIPEFTRMIAEYAAQQHPDMPVMELKAACALTPSDLTVEEAQSLSQLEPFGADNPEPTFLLENAVIKEIRALSGGVHTKLMIELQGCAYEALMFRTAPDQTGLRQGDVCHLMVRLSVNTYQGRSAVNFIVQDIRLSGLKQNRILNAMQTYDKYRRQEPLPAAHYRAMCPTREECVTVYKAVPAKGISLRQLSLQMYANEINYCKMRICLDIFCELGIMQQDVRENRVALCPVTRRVDLQKSEILKYIEQKTREAAV